MDRLSNLPDELLSHILSFLPTKDAVSTSILSKRWKYLWTFVEDLDFSTDDLSDQIPPSFIDFVDSVLAQCKPSIRKFRLRSCLNDDTGCITRWVDEAIGHGVQELDVLGKYLDLPPSFFSCNTVHVLKLELLNGSGFPRIPDSFCFPNLKILYFCIYDPPTDLMKKLFRSCPVLEDLSIKGAWSYAPEEYIFDISSLTLKRLSIGFFGRLHPGPVDKILLHVPNLMYLRIEDMLVGEYSVKGFSSQVEVRVELKSKCCEDEGSKEVVDRAYRLLRGISGVKLLCLKKNATNVLNFVMDNTLPIFHYLTCLKMEIPRLCDWTLLSRLLESSPNLKVLTTAKECYHYHYDTDHSISDNQREEAAKKFRSLPRFREDFEWIEPHCVPDCLLLHLEAVTVSGFTWRESEFDFVKYLLSNGRVLKKLMVKGSRLGLEDELILCKILLGYQRASGSCVIQFA